jgi:hypothetical protein
MATTLARHSSKLGRSIGEPSRLICRRHTTGPPAPFLGLLAAQLPSRIITGACHWLPRQPRAVLLHSQPRKSPRRLFIPFTFLFLFILLLLCRIFLPSTPANRPWFSADARLGSYPSSQRSFARLAS